MLQVIFQRVSILALQMLNFWVGKKYIVLLQINMVSQFLKIPQVRLMKRLQIMEMRENYQMYMVLGWQLPTDNETIRKQGSDLTKFLDIYENSEKRWYLTPVGWVREAT